MGWFVITMFNGLAAGANWWVWVQYDYVINLIAAVFATAMTVYCITQL